MAVGAWHQKDCEAESTGAQCNCQTIDLREGVKHDDGKLPWHLLPFDALEEVVKVLQFGAKKYAPRNWEKGMAWHRLIRAALGHVISFARGQDKDPETGLSHLAHAGCCVLFLLAYTLRRVGTDDRACH
jgi:hypothetical protein